MTRQPYVCLALFLVLNVSGCSSCDDNFDDVTDRFVDADLPSDSGAQSDAMAAGSDDAGATLDAEEPRDATLDSSMSAPDAHAREDADDQATCGDGRIEGDEICDDGNREDGDYCAADCSQETGRCGDGVLQPGIETCDDGVTTDCQGTRDGGDGACVPAGTCSPGYIVADGDCIAEVITQHVHIYVANDCSMMVDPTDFTALPGQKVRFDWHNHSQFYAVDVWQSYIGGYTDLATGATWNERHEWCANINAYVGYSDITTNQACPEHRFFINCPGH